MATLRTINVDLNRQYRNDLNWNFQQIEALIGTSTSEIIRVERESKERDNLLAGTDVEEIIQRIETSADNADVQAQHAKVQGDYAKDMGNYAKQQGDYASQKGDYADEKAIIADLASANANNEASNLSQLKVDVVDATQAANTAVDDATQAASDATSAAAHATTQGDYAKDQGDRVQTIIDAGGFVESVNGQMGTVVLDASDVGAAAEQEVQKIKWDFVSVRAFGDAKDSATIQLALDYAESVGGAIIYVPSGTYLITEIIEVPSNTSLIGLGNVIFKRSAGINAILINKSDGVIGGYGANKDIVVKNIKFDGSSDTISVDFTNVVFGHCSDIIIDECEIYNCSSHHLVELNACKDSVIKNCILRGYTGVTEVVQLDFAGSAPAFPWFGPYDDTPCKNIVIKGNRFLGIGNNTKAIGNHTFKVGVITEFVEIVGNYFELFDWTIYLQDTSNMKIIGNTFKKCMAGVYHKEELNGIHDWVIDDNIFDGGYIAGAEQRLLYGGQTVLTKPFYNIYVRRNQIYICWTHGIALTIGGSGVISDNVISGCGKNAIFLFGGSRVNISNNICTNNNRQSEATRADIVIGGNTQTATNSVILANNNVETLVVNTNSSAVLVVDNLISGSLTNNAGAGAVPKNNLIAGVWTP